jgi:hypothetical protein
VSDTLIVSTTPSRSDDPSRGDHPFWQHRTSRSRWAAARARPILRSVSIRQRSLLLAGGDPALSLCGTVMRHYALVMALGGRVNDCVNAHAMMTVMRATGVPLRVLVAVTLLTALGACGVQVYDPGVSKPSKEWCARFLKFDERVKAVPGAAGPPSESNTQATARIEASDLPGVIDVTTDPRLRDALKAMVNNAKWNLGRPGATEPGDDISIAFSVVDHAAEQYC